jgi:hypothetical protein
LIARRTCRNAGTEPLLRHPIGRGPDVMSPERMLVTHP